MKVPGFKEILLFGKVLLLSAKDLEGSEGRVLIWENSWAQGSQSRRSLSETLRTQLLAWRSSEKPGGMGNCSSVRGICICFRKRGKGNGTWNPQVHQQACQVKMVDTPQRGPKITKPGAVWSPRGQVLLGYQAPHWENHSWKSKLSSHLASASTKTKDFLDPFKGMGNTMRDSLNMSSQRLRLTNNS